MKIVLIRSNPVSPYPRLEKTANSLYKAGNQIQVLAWDRGSDYKFRNMDLELQEGKVPITRFGIKSRYGGGLKANLIPLIKFQIRLFNWLIRNRNKYDVIHAYDLDTGLISWLSSKILNKKIVYDIPDYYIDSHGLKYTKIGSLVKRIEDFIINNSQATIICTEQRVEQIKGTSPKRLEIIHNSPVVKNGYAQSSFLKLNKTQKIKIVYVGILASGRFLEEMIEVVSSRNDCEFHIGGFGELEEYIKDISEKQQNIFFYGKLQYNDTLYLEKNCDIMVAIYDPKVPNHYYAAPNKFYEAIMLGKPLIMAENTGMDKIILDNGIGEVIEYSISGFNKGLDRIIARLEEWDEISEQGKYLYMTQYSWGIMEKKLLDLYGDI